MTPQIIDGDLLAQKTDAIVNTWHCRRTWGYEWPNSVSAAIMLRGGVEPFHELERHHPFSLGGAVLTGAGRLPFRGIIHVICVDLFFQPSKFSVRHSVANAIRVAEENQFTSLAFPIIGSGIHGYKKERALGYMLDEMHKIETDLSVIVVRNQIPSLLGRIFR